MDKKVVFKKIFFSIVTICLAFIILEACFRIIYFLKYPDRRYLTYGFQNVFKLNVRYYRGYDKLESPMKEGDEIYNGFRTEPFSIEKPPDEYRIVTMGGSSVYNLHGTYREGWSYLLQEQLNNELVDAKYKVINTGIPGQTTYEINNLLSAEVLSWNPDLVIIYSLYNHVDIDTAALYKGGGRLRRLFGFVKSAIYDKSLIAAYLMNYIGLSSEFTIRNKLNSYRFLLSQMVKKCKSKNVDIIIVKQLANPAFFKKIHPDKASRYQYIFAPSQYYEFIDIIDEVSDKTGCAVVDFSASSLICKDRLNVILNDKTVHLSEYGNKLLADAIAKKIIEIRI